MLSVLAEVTREWMPHGACLAWHPAVLAAIVVGEALTAMAYAAMAWMLWTQMRAQARGIAVSSGPRSVATYGWFAAFLASCGTGHVLAIVAIWHGYYAAFALWTVLTGLLSQIAVDRLRRAQAESAALWQSPQWRAVTVAAVALAAHVRAADDERRAANG